MDKTIMLTILAILLIGCAKAPETLKIGATLALTGPYSYIGQNELNGLTMAVSEINDAGGIKISLITEDNKGDAKEAVTTVQKLINIDNTPIILSAFTHITTAIKADVFANNRILFYASTVKDFAKENKYAFRDYWDAYDSGKKIAQKAKTHQKIGFLTEISDACKEFEKGVTSEVSFASREEYAPTTTDFKTALLKLKDSDAIIMCTFKQEPIIMKQLKELNMINTPTYHMVATFLPAANTPEIKQLFEENGAISTWYGFAEGTNRPEYLAFEEKYKAKYGTEPSPDAAYAYDDVYVIANAAKTCGINNDCIAQQITATSYNGAGGHLEFDSDRASKRDIPLIKVTDGKWVEV